MIILVLEDVNETRDGIEKLLKADGYRVALARDETDAIESARQQRPDLILVSVAGLPHEVIATARRVRERVLRRRTANENTVGARRRRAPDGCRSDPGLRGGALRA